MLAILIRIKVCSVWLFGLWTSWTGQKEAAAVWLVESSCATVTKSLKGGCS